MIALDEYFAKYNPESTISDRDLYYMQSWLIEEFGKTVGNWVKEFFVQKPTEEDKEIVKTIVDKDYLI